MSKMNNSSIDANVFNYTLPSTSHEVDEILIDLVLNYWKEFDVMSAVEDNSWSFYSRMTALPPTDNFARLYENVLGKVRNLILVDDKRERALHLVKPIGLLLCEWIYCNKEIDEFNAAECLDSIVFESPYSIDYSSSINLWLEKCPDQAKCLTLFNKTCYFCVEHKVFLLWDWISLDKKLEFSYLEMNTDAELYLHYWIHKLENKLSAFVPELKKYVESRWHHWLFQDITYKERNLNWLMLRVSVLEGNTSAVKYFFRTLTNKEKYSNLTPCLRAAFLTERDYSERDPKFVHIIQFLYAQMNVNDQVTFLQMYQTFFVSLIPKYWQCQQRALPIIQASWNCVNDELYTFIIRTIARRMAEGRYVQENLLERIWEVTSKKMRKKLFSFVASHAHCLEIFSENAVTTTEKFLRNASTYERNKILSFYEV